MLEKADVAVVSLDVDAAPLRALLSPDERERAARFVFHEHRRRFIVARARLRQLLGARLGVGAETIAFRYAPAGKPALAAGHRDLRFNLAHCGDVAVYAFADGCEVGVDVERERAIEDAEAIAERVFSPAERDACRARGFLYCWTRKEAFVKALGSGLSCPLTELDLSAAPQGWSVRSFVPHPGLIGAVAVQEQVRTH
jgi:4'-phosphopantetheinyl transferase